MPDAILRKPGPLDDAEWGFVRQHTVVGERILSAAPALVPGRAASSARATSAATAAATPTALAGEEIPLGARIVAVCDAYHAMTSERPYGQARPHEAAIEELRRCAGTPVRPRDRGDLLLASWTPPARPDGAVRVTRRRGGGLMRFRLATAAVCGLALVLPAHAFAGTASTAGSTLTVTATPGQTNRLAVTLDGSNLRVSETGSGASLTSSTGCVPEVTNQVLCPLAGITLIAMTGDNGDDWLTELHLDPRQPGRRT